MTMHLVRGMSSLNTKKRKVKKKPGWSEAEVAQEKWVRKMGGHPDELKETLTKENFPNVVDNLFSEDKCLGELEFNKFLVIFFNFK